VVTAIEVIFTYLIRTRDLQLLYLGFVNSNSSVLALGTLFLAANCFVFFDLAPTYISLLFEVGHLAFVGKSYWMFVDGVC
jgi:hypothetical protein